MGLNPKKCSYPLKPPKSAQTLKKRSGMAESVSNQGFARKKCYNGIPSKFLKLLTWTFIQLLLFTQDCLDGDQVLADSCAYRIVIWVGLDRPDRSSICTLWEFSETEILAQLEVTGGSVPLASKVKGRTVRLKLSQVNSASMDSFRCCTIDPGRRVPVHNSWTRSPKESKHSESLELFDHPLLSTNCISLVMIGRLSVQFDWLRFKRLMLASFQKVMVASEQDFRATKWAASKTSTAGFTQIVISACFAKAKMQAAKGDLLICSQPL